MTVTRTTATMLTAMFAVFVALVVAARAEAGQFPIVKISEDETTVTYGWAARGGIDGYRFFLDGKPVSHTWDADRTNARFTKNGVPSVRPIPDSVDEGVIIVTPPPPPPPPPPVGNVVNVSGTLTSTQVNSYPTGTTVRGPFNVNGTLTMTRSGLTVERVSARALSVYGASNVTVRDSTFDNGGNVPANQSIIENASNLQILNNTFRNFYGRAAETHSEALFFGAGSSGLIEGNLFENNGNTAHIFFTWWPTYGSWPHDVCVRGNTFGPTAGAYFSVNMREEIPTSSNIRIAPGQPTVAGLSANQSFVRSC
jgi:hypothetical protein